MMSPETQPALASVVLTPAAWGDSIYLCLWTTRTRHNQCSLHPASLSQGRPGCPENFATYCTSSNEFCVVFLSINLKIIIIVSPNPLYSYNFNFKFFLLLPF